MVSGTERKPPAVLLDTVIWRRLSTNPGYLAKIRQLKKLAAAMTLHIAVPEIVVSEFQRRIPEIEASWPRSVERFGNVAVSLEEHFGRSRELTEAQAVIDRFVSELKARGSQNLREVQEVLAAATCCRTTSEALIDAAQRSLAGRPPSKTKPSIGDCLIWQCVLAHLGRADVLFCTDNTVDFCDANDATALHPDLLAEAGAKPHTLTFLRNFDSVIETFESLEEPRIRWDAESSDTGPDRDRPSQCACGAKGSFSPGHWAPSQYGGGLSWQYKCRACNRRFDTGDYFD